MAVTIVLDNSVFRFLFFPTIDIPISVPENVKSEAATKHSATSSVTEEDKEAC